MSNDIDFEQLIELLDRALTSKDPKVISALKKFLFIAALATEDTEEEGPFRNLVRRLEAVEAAQRYTTTTTWPSTGTPPVWYGGSSTSPYTHQYINDGSTSTTGTWQFSNIDMSGYSVTPTSTTITSSTSTESMIDQTLEDLKKLASESLAK